MSEPSGVFISEKTWKTLHAGTRRGILSFMLANDELPPVETVFPLSMTQVAHEDFLSVSERFSADAESREYLSKVFLLWFDNRLKKTPRGGKNTNLTVAAETFFMQLVALGMEKEVRSFIRVAESHDAIEMLRGRVVFGERDLSRGEFHLPPREIVNALGGAPDVKRVLSSVEFAALLPSSKMLEVLLSSGLKPNFGRQRGSNALKIREGSLEFVIATMLGQGDSAPVRNIGILLETGCATDMDCQSVRHPGSSLWDAYGGLEWVKAPVLSWFSANRQKLSVLKPDVRSKIEKTMLEWGREKTGVSVRNGL